MKACASASEAAITIHELVAAGGRRLREAGIDDVEAGLDARLLAEHLLGWDAARFHADGSDAAAADFASRYDRLIARRAGREPIAYITGATEFWSLTFEVSPAVLIPRPETEGIVEVVLAAFADAGESLSIADVCTGSGCLAVALAHERPRATVTATDLSAAALEVAARNARRHGVDGRIRFVHADLFEGVGADPRAGFDVIVANPPYVPERDRAGLPPEVRDHEPPLALFAGEDGLALIRRVVAEGSARLRTGGLLAIEFGFGQGQAVRAAIDGNPRLRLVELRPDLQGIPRVAVATRNAVV